MPDPTPTTANSAPPPPRGARGTAATMGVVGIAPALAIALSTATQAQIIPTGTPAADILLSQAITEHRVFLTCSALDPAIHARITESWQRDVTAAAAILADHQVPPEAITAFISAARPAALMPAEDTPWAEIKGLCDTHPDWQSRLSQSDFIILGQRIPQVIP